MLRDATRRITGVKASLYKGKPTVSRSAKAWRYPCCGGVPVAYLVAAGSGACGCLAPRQRKGITGVKASLYKGKPAAPSTSKGYGVQSHEAKRNGYCGAIALHSPQLRSAPVSALRASRVLLSIPANVVPCLLISHSRLDKPVFLPPVFALPVCSGVVGVPAIPVQIRTVT